MCFILPCVVDHPHCMHDHLNTASNKKLILQGSASPPQVAQSFRQASVSSCPSWVNIKRLRVEGENMRRWWQVFTSGVSCGLSVSHTQVSQSQETHCCCQNLAKHNQPTLSLWLILVYQLRPSVVLKNTPRKDSFISSWWPFSPSASLIYLDDVFCVSCRQISMTRPEEKKTPIKLEQKQGDDKRKRWFSAMKKC